MEQRHQLSVDAINEFISFSFTINSNCQNDHCSVHEFLRDVRKKVDEQEKDLDKTAVFKQFYKDIIVMFSVIGNFFSKKKFQQILDIKTFTIMVKARRISNDLFRIVDFSNFCSNINDMILDQKECEKGCEYEKYDAELKRVLMRNDKCE